MTIWEYLNILAGKKSGQEIKKKTLVFASASTWGKLASLIFIAKKLFHLNILLY